MSIPPPSAERLVFAQTVEALFIHGVSGRLGDQARERLAKAGLDVSRPLLPAYPAQVFSRCVFILSEELCPGQSGREAYRYLGQRTMLGLDETLVGRASIALARLVGPMRAMQTLPKGMRSGSSYSRATAQVLGPTTVELHVTGYALPYGEFQVGTIEGLFQMLRLKEPRCEIVAFEPAEETLRVRTTW